MAKKPSEFTKITVSDHAVQRYKERTGSTDCDALIRETIVTLFFYTAINVWYRSDKRRRLSDKHYKCGSLIFVVTGCIIATIYPLERLRFAWKDTQVQPTVYYPKEERDIKHDFYGDSASHTAYQKIKRTKKRRRANQKR